MGAWPLSQEESVRRLPNEEFRHFCCNVDCEYGECGSDLCVTAEFQAAGQMVEI